MKIMFRWLQPQLDITITEVMQKSQPDTDDELRL